MAISSEWLFGDFRDPGFAQAQREYDNMEPPEPKEERKEEVSRPRRRVRIAFYADVLVPEDGENVFRRACRVAATVCDEVVNGDYYAVTDESDGVPYELNNWMVAALDESGATVVKI